LILQIISRGVVPAGYVPRSIGSAFSPPHVTPENARSLDAEVETGESRRIGRAFREANGLLKAEIEKAGIFFD